MAHVQRVSAPRLLEEEQATLCGPMLAQTTLPKKEFIQEAVSAFQNYRQEKRATM
jgi:hypothetical protein